MSWSQVTWFVRCHGQLAATATFVWLMGCGGGASTPTADAGATTPDSGSAADGGMSQSGRCSVITESINAAGFAGKVTVTCDGTYALVASDTYPDHVKMTGITGTNDQLPVPAVGYKSPIVLAPSRAAAVTSIDAALGVAVNGVPIYDYTSQGTNSLSVYDPKADTKLTGELDQCNGHAGRGDDYHYHAAPTCMMGVMKNKGPAAIVGWAFDGYPIYGNTNPDGTVIKTGELDVCNGKSDPVFGYRYHTSDVHPYITQCLSGNFDTAKAPRVAPLSAQDGGGGRPPGAKAPGGVTNLVFVEAPDGTRTMTYQHQGTSYSIAYRSASAPNCYTFSDQSYTTAGVLKTGTYCR